MVSWLVGGRPNRNWRSSTLLVVVVAVEEGLGLAGYYGAFFVSRVGMEPHLILVTGSDP